MFIDSLAEALGVSKGLILGSAGGSVVSTGLSSAAWRTRVLLALGSFVVALFTASLVMWFFDLPKQLEAGVGCIIGLFGMLIADRVADTIRAIDLVDLITGWLRRIFGGGAPPDNNAPPSTKEP